MALASNPQLVGRVLGGRYRIQGPVGIGGSAHVHVAEDLQLGRKVAVKLLHDGLADDQAFLRRFRAEARAAAALNHPHLVAVYDWGFDGVPYLITEYLSGGSLRGLLDNGVTLSPGQALQVGLEALRGLDHAHARNLVHRDVKPGNLLFGEDGRLRVADFGLARALSEAAWTEPEGAVLGTVRYTSPEQAAGRQVDGRSDVYSLALCIIEAITGEVPFSRDTTAGTLRARLDCDLVPPDEVGELYEPLVMAGRRNPKARSTSRQFGRALLKTAPLLDRPAPLPLDVFTSPKPIVFADPDSTVLEARASDGTTGGLTPDLRREVSDAAWTAGLQRSESPDPISSRAPLGSRPVLVPDVDDQTVVDVPAAEPAVAAASSGSPWGRVAMASLVFASLLAAGFAIAGRVGVRVLDQEEATAFVTSTAPARVIPTFTVGSYVSRSQEDVLAEINAGEPNKWNIAWEDGRRDGTRPGDIIDQSPPAGVELTKGEVLTLTRSLGEEFIVVPTDLVGLPQVDGEVALVDLGLALGTVTEQPDDSVPAGQIVSVVDAGSQVERNSTVDFVISSGPPPVAIPADLVGAPVADVESTLTAVGLAPVSAEVFDEEVDKGLVISIEPAVGTELRQGAEVQLTVSRGPRYYEVPNVVGLDAVAGADQLAEAGFRVVDVVGPPNTEILATDPPAGEFHRKNKDVRIVTRAG